MCLKTKKHENKTHIHKYLAITPIFATIILLGITAVLAGVMYLTFDEQTDPYLVSSNIEIQNLHAVEKDGRLTITATIKNSGQSTIDHVFIEDISVGDLRIGQNENGYLFATDGTKTRYYCQVNLCTNNLYLQMHNVNDIPDKISKNSVRGFTLSGGFKNLSDLMKETDSVIQGEGSNIFKLSLENTESIRSALKENPTISAINPSEKLTISLRFVIDENTVLSNVYTARVKQG